ncbi:unnamed protein product [Paramecium octaurelia]|uniref:Uncharacterized protein n=1 Tax=Paramecium octaurelia TaxID=43137 RepID=A0A8S1W9T9_PAROT|nr:unnamed protein product [Paramecium octaurelia]
MFCVIKEAKRNNINIGSYLVHLFHNRNNCLYLQRLWIIFSSKQNRNRNIFTVSISILSISSIDIRINRQQNRISILNFMVCFTNFSLHMLLHIFHSVVNLCGYFGNNNKCDWFDIYHL